jgi:hypothetical protein
VTLPSGSEEHRQGDVVQFGSQARRYGRWPATLLVACLLVTTAAVVISQSGSNRPASPPVTVTSIGHPILGVRAGWELFGLDNKSLVTVQFAGGRIVRTTVPRLAADGIVSLVAARGEALIRPLDNVRGYVVADGQPAQPLTGVLAHGGTLLPGPTLTQQWMDSGNLVLVGPAAGRNRRTCRGRRSCGRPIRRSSPMAAAAC